MTDDKAVLDPIPHGAPLEEIIEFWDTHDLGDYWDQLEEVHFEVRLPRRVALAKSVYEQLLEEADRERVSPETLANLWLAEKLREVQRPAPAPATTAPIETQAEPAGVLAEEKAKYTAEKARK